jgi:hypothetical protein
MLPDLVTLIRRDHDDITVGLDVIVSSTTPVATLRDGLDAVRLGFVVHAVAEERIFSILARRQPLPVVVDIVRSSTTDHVEQEALLRDLGAVEPGTASWFELAREIRNTMLRHAACSELVPTLLRDAVSSRLLAQLASSYATERMRVLAATYPAELGVAS